MLFNVLLKTKSDICYALIEMEKKSRFLWWNQMLIIILSEEYVRNSIS